MKTKILLIIAFVIYAGVSLQAQSVSQLLEEGAKLEKQMKESQALFKYKQALKLNPSNLTANIKVSWLSSRVGFRVADREKKKEYFAFGMKTAEKAVALKPNSAEAHYVKAVAHGRMAQISGAKKRVGMLDEIEKHAKKCIALNPKHAGGYYVMARMNFRVANKNSAERAAINLLGGSAKQYTNENALAYYKKAVTLRPNYILYWRDLAVSYAKMKQKDKAIGACKKALALPIQTEDDPGYKLSCKSLLAKLQSK